MLGAALALVALSLAEETLERPLPPPPIPDLAPLRPPAPWSGGEPLPAFSSGEVHADALRKDRLHGTRFFVEEVAGDGKSTRVVFLIPQFHRNPVLPIAWTSLGEAIAEVQGNVDALVTRLVHAHGLRCIGTEGSWLENLDYPYDLRQPAQWAEDLARRKEAARRALGSDLSPLEPSLETVSRLLERSLKRHVAFSDGVGLALSRLEGGPRVHRFGIEDQALNQEALRLLAELRKVEEALAELDPETQSEVADAMGRMWLAEIGPYREEVLRPLEEAFQKLDEARVALRADGAEDASLKLGRFVSLAKLVANAVVKQGEVEAFTAYYERVAKGPLAEEEERAPPRKLSARERREKRRLEAKKKALYVRYDEITMRARERRAAEKVLARLGAAGTCAVVMGAAHKEGLKEALLEVAKGELAVIVVAPYDFSDVEAPEEAADDAEQ